MKLTKTQINYLENKLDKVAREKRENFIKQIGQTTLDKEIVQRLKNGKIKLLPKAELISVLEETVIKSSYRCSFFVSEIISQEDKKQIEKEIKEKQELIDNFSNKLYETKSNVLDKIVLEGLDIEKALAEFDKIEV